MWNSFLVFITLLTVSFSLYSQNCTLTLNGYVLDADTQTPLEFVNLYFEEIGTGTVTDSLGFFEITSLCHQDYHLTISHVGCQAKHVFFHLHADSTVTFTMEHYATELSNIVVKEKSAFNTSQQQKTINEQTITDNANENFSNILEKITGVTSLKNGNSIAKPVVNGLYGNRLTILNNGIMQSGQQWGNDHSPEIDALTADKITVVKGTNSLEYMGANMGGLVILQSGKIDNDPHLHGGVNYFFESNGLGNTLNIQLQQKSPFFAWKVNGTIKKSGDKKAPNYYLNNTGNEEANLAIKLEKAIKDKWFIDFYASTFNTKLGILRGSHIGNLTDLEEALERDTPFFTETKFSYEIEAPKQHVNHYLTKLNLKHLLNKTSWIYATFATQINNRKEFDVRRSGLSDTPALSLKQLSVFAELKYQKLLKNNWALKTGIQHNITDNTNNPETGILPLIPDYISYQSALFFLLSKQFKNSYLNTGIRYDHMLQNVVAITTSLPHEIVRYQNNFSNISASLGYTYELNKQYSLNGNIGYSSRNPAINELYSNGLHQGVSGIEEGNINLKTEQAFKTSIEFKANITPYLSVENFTYYQFFKNYIFLNPQDEIRLTIRGAFPVFKYEQINAEIFGTDIITKVIFSKKLNANLSYSFIKGIDRSNQVSLINIPSNNFKATLAYQFEKPIKIGKKQLENFELAVSNKYTFKQNSLTNNQDFVAPPEAYNLLNFKAATDIQANKLRFRLIFKINNLLNTKYREYLNRQRYFADDLGINVLLGINVKF